jgi:putative phosphoesterase
MQIDKKQVKLLIFSDSHGSIRYMTEAMRLHAPTSDVIIHLGDGTADMDILREHYACYKYLCVSGNYEDYLNTEDRLPPLLFYETCGMRLMLCHGHRYGVKYGYESLIAAAYKEKADIALFGHTHQSYQEYIPSGKSPASGIFGDLRLFCPGSISRPSFGTPSYGIIEIRENGIMMTNAVLQGGYGI